VPIVKKSALIGYSADQMFDLVADMESYPKFLPWCAGASIVSRERDRVCGRIEVARLGIHQAFTTCNRFEAGKHMQIDLLDGPFRKLTGAWSFLALRENACKVELELDFELSGGLIDKAFGAVFHQLANTMVDAFCKRADEVYSG
jgi:ribosome-associated toxin RatA of RatAB toxin-antitoxin module